MSSLGDRIKERRREIPRFRDNAQALADEVGVNRVTLSKWENGRSEPRGENLSRLASALGVSEIWLVRGTESEGSTLHESNRPSYGASFPSGATRLIGYADGLRDGGVDDWVERSDKMAEEMRAAGDLGPADEPVWAAYKLGARVTAE